MLWCLGRVLPPLADGILGEGGIWTQLTSDEERTDDSGDHCGWWVLREHLKRRAYSPPWVQLVQCLPPCASTS